MFERGSNGMQGVGTTAGRKRAAIELVAREDAELRQTARRYSLCEDDAEDAYQRALEILLVKAPSDRPHELVGWTKTVVKHEALAIRRQRERMLGAGDDEVGDPIARIPATGASPGERTERREQVARSREALRALKPAELRALTLIAAGYSYAEIGAATGWSQTKVNRCLAEGRERFRRLLTHSEDGSRCAELRPLLSAYCDGQASAEHEAVVREHLRACAGCRATVRAYRAAPAAVAALAPALPVSRSLLERAQEFFLGLHSRLPGLGGRNETGLTQVAAAGGTRGAGMAALAKALAICAGTVGGAAACVVAGVAPLPLDIEPQHRAEARIERISERAAETVTPAAAEPEPAPAPAKTAAPAQPVEPVAESAAPEVATEATEVGAIEYAPPAEPTPPTPPAAAEPSAGSGSAAGEFGP
ncbi:MAG TPA: sigma-70 family RNA polymerase sigma factor [Solirubrobacterales bacterium]|nr:sigma-70 family RNA polymerase sigma factor [Solirubrobacterales bacterium]